MKNRPMRVADEVGRVVRLDDPLAELCTQEAYEIVTGFRAGVVAGDDLQQAHDTAPD